jgi:hypothetical protein
VSIENVLLLGAIGLPLAMLLLRLAYMVGLVHEISAMVWMLPL